jgi:hypothetical protein
MRHYHTLKPQLYARLIRARMEAAATDNCALELEAETRRIREATGMNPLWIACDLLGGRASPGCQGPTAGPAGKLYRYCLEHCPIQLHRSEPERHRPEPCGAIDRARPDTDRRHPPQNPDQ